MYYHDGGQPTFEYNLYDITYTNTVTVTENSYTAYNICTALYILNTAYPKGNENPRMEKVYARKHDLLPELHSQGRVQLVGYHEDVQKKGKEKGKTKQLIYYIYQLGSAKYGFHIPVEKHAVKTVKSELYYVGPLHDEDNERVTEKRRSNLPKYDEQVLEGYIDYLIHYFRDN